MANTSIVLREPNATKETALYILFRFNNQRAKIRTKLSITPADWSKTKKRVKDSYIGDTLVFNTLLDKYQKKIQK